jgi:hypothetical protein
MNNKNIKQGSRWFALTAENHKGVEHTVMQVGGEEEEGGVLTEGEIITWSNHNDDKHGGGGMTWAGNEATFLKIFKFIGFGDKKA